MALRFWNGTPAMRSMAVLGFLVFLLTSASGGEPAATPSAAPLAPPRPPKTWENTLGMRFVPVPGTRVWFCVWETRVRDYQAFLTATSRPWPAPGFPQGLTHPAVNVSWDDAQAFCRWLTARERTAGTVQPSAKYRLPLDWEWSVAVGLANERGAFPNERAAGNTNAFPWGKSWPPPAAAGNYCDRRAGSQHQGWTFLKGYDDGFAETAPVGAFAPNSLGLYDLGGNVWEWCEDRFDREQELKVLRGASWGDYDRDALLSACRYGARADSYFSTRGFRVVLESPGIP